VTGALALPGAWQRGQALVETLVATSLLLPLWLGVVYLSRWHDLQHATIAAARYAAFEAHASAGREAPQRIEESTRRRLFSREVDRFTAAAPATEAAGALPQWADHRGTASLLDREAGPRVEVTAAPQPAFVADTEQQAMLLIAPARAVGGPAFDLQRGASRRATVRVALRHGEALPPPFGGLRFTLTERLELLVDPWAARDPSQVVSRVEALSPVGRLRELVRPLEPVRWAVSLFEPAVERLCLGRTEPEIVPPDRIVGSRSPAIDLRTRRC
jgi:hypothetical protein